MVLDSLKRPLRDLRISVTDRCNFRCAYCMPKTVYDKGFRYVPHASLLSFEEITRLAGIATQLGVEKLRITGGEPLLRKNIEVLIARLTALRTPQGVPLELTLTTNGALLARKAKALKAAGLTRLTVSLDAVDPDIFAQMNDVDFPLMQVLQGLDAAQAAGFAHTKINMVVRKNQNAEQLLPMAQFFLNRAEHLRFIEFMDVGQTNRWCMDDVLSSAQMRAVLETKFTLEALGRQRPSDTAERWRATDRKSGQSTKLGFISSVSRAFCADCNRARLSTEGKLYLCLFASQGYDLRSLLRSGADDAALLEDIRGIWQRRGDRYSELRALGRAPQGKRIEMSYIGG